MHRGQQRDFEAVSVPIQNNASGNDLPPTCNESVSAGRTTQLHAHAQKRLRIGVLLALMLSLGHSTLHAEAFSEYDLLLLDFTLKHTQLAQSVTAYRLDNTIVVSLAEAAAAFEFPIVVDGAGGTASGWFINKERRFELNINTAEVTTEGIRQTLSPGDAITHDDSIYVPLKTFSRWFPVDLSAH